jgi:hypothetical protein
VPRFIDEFVMPQPETEQALDRLPDLTRRTAMVILIETGSARNCSQTHSLNGSSFDPTGGRSYLGGASDATARTTVSCANPNDLATCRCECRSTNTNRLISAHCSTPTTHSSSPDPPGSDERPRPAGHHRPFTKWPNFQPALVVQYSGHETASRRR